MSARSASTLSLLALLLLLTACGGGGEGGGTPPSSSSSNVNPGVGTAQAVLSYNFNAGDSLAAQNGWSFASPNWALASAADGSGLALPFTYPGRAPGHYGMSEMRFDMPPADGFWIQMRWHVPANYLHRHDTQVDMVGALAAGWQIGDLIRGADGVSQGTISWVSASSVFLRFANKSAYDSVWTGTLSNLTRNSSLIASGASQWPANNKLLAVWADGYDSAGLGPTIVWQTDSDWYAGSTRSVVTVGYAKGSQTGTGAAASGGVLITSADHGKYMDLIFHGRFSTAPGANDGVIRTFVRKQGASAYTMAHNITNADLDKRSDVASHLQPWQAGYLMGWSNSGFDDTTTFFISQIAYFNALPAVLAGVSP